MSSSPISAPDTAQQSSDAIQPEPGNGRGVIHFGWSETPDAPSSSGYDWEAALKEQQALKPKAPEAPASASSPEQTPEPQAPEKPAAPAPPAAESKAATVAFDDLLSREFTDEEVEALVKKHPSLKARADRLVANQVGIKLEQERARLTADESKFQADTETYEEYLAAAKATDPAVRAQYEQAQQDPEVAAWVADYLKRKAARTAPQQAKEATVDREVILTDFNRSAADEFARTLASAPWFKDLGDDFRSRIEGRTQKTDQSWLSEWFGDFVAESAKRTEALVAAAREAAAADARAQSRPSNNAPNPPAAGTPTAFDPRDVLNRHAFYGFDEAAGGVTPEQLARAKKALNLEL